MKRVLVLFLALLSLAACQKEDAAEPTVSAYPQTWQLVKSTSSWTRTVRTGSALHWQETYVFRADSTFTKTRQSGDQTTEASGTFSVRTYPDLPYYPDGQYALLTYSQPSSLLGICSANLKQHLTLSAKDTIRGDERACDGPLLEYTRVK
jgi:hypothetical protein